MLRRHPMEAIQNRARKYWCSWVEVTILVGMGVWHQDVSGATQGAVN